ncbi:PREDICTED: amelotin [Miniopterus natalensis]|uniref:amelotin n=1 Tax=Miniopterus natalensis TaxID=291302 RepID=UPI0007A6F181|nr:PREDICTED: amelotin [Miniopterus natalensis]
MKTMILLFYLLGSTQSLPMQLNPALGLPPAQLVPDQTTLSKHQQPNQVFPSLSLIPLTQMLTLGSDLQLLNLPAGLAPAAQTLPLALGGLNVQQQLQPQMLPLIVAQLGAQGTILSSEELPVAPHIFTGLIFQPLFPGAILPTSQANPDVQGRILPAGQAGVNPAIQGTPESPFLTPSLTDDDLEVTTPAGIQRGMSLTEETTTGSPNEKDESQTLVVSSQTLPTEGALCSETSKFETICKAIYNVRKMQELVAQKLHVLQAQWQVQPYHELDVSEQLSLLPPNICVQKELSDYDLAFDAGLSMGRY